MTGEAVQEDMTADGYINDLAKKVGFSRIWNSAAFKGFSHIFTAGNRPGFCMGWGDFFGFSSTEKVINSQPWSVLDRLLTLRAGPI